MQVINNSDWQILAKPLITTAFICGGTYSMIALVDSTFFSCCLTNKNYRIVVKSVIYLSATLLAMQFGTSTAVITAVGLAILIGKKMMTNKQDNQKKYEEPPQPETPVDPIPPIPSKFPQVFPMARPKEPTTQPHLFIGVEELKKFHEAEVKYFENLAQRGCWGQLREAHFDWWLFPIDVGSNGRGNTYNVRSNHVESLKQDPDFMNGLRYAAKLICAGWGWDIENKSPYKGAWKYDLSTNQSYERENLSSREEVNQAWNDYDVRLYKIVRSLRLFGEDTLADNILSFLKSEEIEDIEEKYRYYLRR